MRNPALDAWGDYDRDDPFPLFAQVQADGPVHEVTLADGHRAWLIVGHEEAKAALNHGGLSKDMHAALARDGAVVAEGLPGPAFARHMLSVDPPDHTRLRRLASAAFGRPRIAALRPRVQAIVDGLLDDLAACGDTVVDLVKGFAFPLPFTVISELLGVPEPDRDQLGGWFITLLAPSSAPEPPAEAVAASANIVRYLTELLARKHAAPGEDLVTDLVRAADQGALSEQEMLSTIFQLVVAGHDTTTSLIGNGTVALLLHPEQRDALVADPALVPHAIEEILRWDAPVPHSTFRYSTQDVVLGGTVIPAFAQVIISLAAAGRDPARYANQETFDITRADTSHLAFGHGIHHCLGARLARLEGVIALTTLHGRFPSMRLAVPRSALRWGHGDGLVLRGLSELPVILRPQGNGYHARNRLTRGSRQTRAPAPGPGARRSDATSRKTFPAKSHGIRTVMTDTELADYRIHDLESFNRTTGAGHEVAGLYFYQQLDCLVDLAYGVACDFFKRPHLYINVNGLSETLARLHARYGTNETLPSGPQRDMVFLPIFGSGGVRTLPPGVAAAQETGDFPALRDDLLKAAQAFAERQSDTGVEMLRQRVKDAHKPMADYLNGLAGDSVKWSRFNALPTLTENVSYTILRKAGIAAVFGAPPPSGDFPYVEESSGQKLVENVWKQLAGNESPVLNRERISNLQRVALRGAEALATIIDFQETFDNGDLDRLITKLYTWDAALWSVKASGTPHSAAATSVSYGGAPLPAPPTSRSRA